MTDTIAAIATGMIPSGIGIIRISGPDALLFADRVYKSKTGKKLCDQAGYTVHYGWIISDENIIDEALVSVMKAPHSYTGEDTAEINCHGSVIAVQKVLEAVIKAGARPAMPGEFTRRAFLNGRIDLSQAEAVMDLISAKSDYALASSVSQLSGSLKKRISDIRDNLLYELAYIESALDDPEHISLDGYKDRIKEIILNEKSRIKTLIDSTDKGRYIEDGIKTVIIGKPNVGKSSLLNMMTGSERAIVTDIPGTTRDVIEESVRLGKTALIMLDTAGIHESQDTVEQIGIKLAWEKANESDLILYVIDGSSKPDDKDKEILEHLKNKKVIVLINKTDLKQRTFPEQIKEICDFNILEISAKNGYGEEELKTMIDNMFFKGELSFNDEIYITNVRHKELLKEAFASLENVADSIEKDMPEDFLSIDIMGAVEKLEEIIGGNLSEDLVNEIFSKFCMGK